MYNIIDSKYLETVNLSYLSLLLLLSNLKNNNKKVYKNFLSHKDCTN